MPSVANGFSSRGYATIPYPTDVRLSVEKTANLWKSFCQLPTDMKRKFEFSNDAGYELKDVGEYSDWKENFHYKRSEFSRLMGIAESVPSSVACSFLSASEETLFHIKRLVREVSLTIVGEYGIPGFAKKLLEGEDDWIVRNLHYFGQKPGEIIAKAHADKGGITLHTYESHGGLEVLGLVERKWYPVHLSNGETIVFPSLQGQLISQGRLNALCHRVVGIPNASGDRYSMVCFADFPNFPKWNKEANKSVQHHEAGFNYEMSHEEFEKFFVIHDRSYAF